jgi:hypothetical protein
MHYWFNVYSNLLMKYWNNMTPSQYGGLLITVSLIGWLLMKNGAK